MRNKVIAMTNNPQTAPAASPASSLGLTSPAPSAAAPCPPEETGSVSIALTPAVLKPINDANGNGQKSPLTFTSGERQTVRHCEHCGARLVIKRPKNFKPKRFCNSQCKRRHFYLLHGK